MEIKCEEMGDIIFLIMEWALVYRFCVLCKQPGKCQEKRTGSKIIVSIKRNITDS